MIDKREIIDTVAALGLTPLKFDLTADDRRVLTSRPTIRQGRHSRRTEPPPDPTEKPTMPERIYTSTGDGKLEALE